MTDRVQRLREAAQTRHDTTLQRAEDTVRRLAKRGETITFRRVADAAGVSRSWLYQQTELRAQIDQLRHRSATGTRAAIPTAEQATADSLRQQLRTYREELNRLRTENQTLREQLAPSRHRTRHRDHQPILTTSRTCPQQHTPRNTTHTLKMIKRTRLMRPISPDK